MSSFIDAFQRGQQAADAVARARLEVSEILGRLREDVLEASDGRVLIDIATHLDSPEPKNIAEAIGSTIFSSSIKRKYLSAKNPKVTSPAFRRLARWSQGEEGYPCTISYGKEEQVCFDADSLEAALASLIGKGSVGEVLQAVSNEGL